MTQAKQIVEAYYAAFEKKDLALARTILHDEFTFDGPMMQASSADDMMDKMKQFDCEYSSTIHQIIADGEHVAVNLTCEMGSPDAVSLDMSEWFTVRDGKVLSSKLFFDPTKMAAAQGCTEMNG